MRKIAKYILIGIIALIVNYKLTIWLQPYCAAPKDFTLHYLIHLMLLMQLFLIICLCWRELVGWINKDNPYHMVLKEKNQLNVFGNIINGELYATSEPSIFDSSIKKLKKKNPHLSEQLDKFEFVNNIK